MCVRAYGECESERERERESALTASFSNKTISSSPEHTRIAKLAAHARCPRSKMGVSSRKQTRSPRPVRLFLSGLRSLSGIAGQDEKRETRN